MIYEAALFGLIVAASVKSDARPFAVVMSANWAANYVLSGWLGLYAWVAAADGIAFITLAAMTLWRVRWWSFLIAELTFLSVVIHAGYWFLFGLGWYFGPQYHTLLNGAFILSALILVIGGHGIDRIVGSIFNRIAHAANMRARRLHCVLEVARCLTKVQK